MPTNVRQLEEQLRRDYNFGMIIGHNVEMIKLMKLIVKVKDVDVPVLIEGESGTGKELVARAIHYNSKRQAEPLLCINCGAIPENLLESEFFGHEKGAFTGATHRKIGHIQTAGGGTIFLDEIDEMSLSLQVKLLRVIQWGEFTPVGGSIPRKSKVRFVAATKCNLQALVKKGAFRDDLYYRLNVLHLRIPPLRQRKDDIPVLCEYFLEKYRRYKDKKKLRIEPATVKLLLNHDFPGNVRELEHIVQRIIILGEADAISPEQLPLEIRNLKTAPDVPASELVKDTFKANKQRVVEAFEKEFLCQKLAESNGVILSAAKKAGMYEPNFRRKMQKYGISAKVFVN